jgi:erythrin-vacuolar iron transport family protein
MVCGPFAHSYPQSARMFDEMADEEDTHRSRLIEEHRRRFGEVIPLIRREHVAGFYNRRPGWLIENLGLERIREEAKRMESEARNFYLNAAQRTSDAGNPAIARSSGGGGIGP